MPSWGEHTSDFDAGHTTPAEDTATFDRATAAAPPSESPVPPAGSPATENLPAPSAETTPAQQPPEAAKPARAPRRVRRGRGKRIVGLKIGASQIAAASVVNGDQPHVADVVRMPLEPGIVVGGEVRDPAALTEALKAFFKKHKLPKRNVRLGISTNRVGVRTFELPAISDRKQLENAIRYRAQEVLPVPFHDAVLDYRVLNEGPGADAEKTQRVLLVVTYRELVERYAAACRNAGVQLVGIDLEAFALLRALASPIQSNERPDAALVAMAVGHDRSTLAVSDGATCEFTRVLEWGGATVNEEIGRALNIAPSAAEPIKRLVGLDSGEVPEGLSAEEAGRARQAIRQQVHALAGELVSSLRFYQEQPGSLGISELVVSGGSAGLGGFADELQRVLNVPVRVGDPFARVRVGKKVKANGSAGSLAVAIGLGIED